MSTSNDNLYRFVKASEQDMKDMGRKHWRCGKTHEPLSTGVAYNLFFKTKDGHPVEWLEKIEADQQELWKELYDKGLSREDMLDYIEANYFLIPNKPNV